MSETTHKKLREAAFFLQRFVDEERQIFRPEPEARDFYLSAFLSSARAAGDFVGVEHGDRYKAWYARRKAHLSAEESRLLVFTNLQRVATVHIRGAAVELQSRSVPLVELQIEMQRKGGDLQFSHMPGTPQPTTERNWLAFAEYPSEPAADVCARYLSLLNKLHQEFESNIAA